MVKKELMNAENGHSHCLLRPFPVLADQVVSQTRTQAQIQTHHWPCQAKLTFPFCPSTGGNSCCSQMLFMQNYYHNHTRMLLDLFMPPD